MGAEGRVAASGAALMVPLGALPPASLRLKITAVICLQLESQPGLMANHYPVTGSIQTAGKQCTWPS